MTIPNNYSAYVYQRSDVVILLPSHVDDVLLASNSNAAIQEVKSQPASHFKLYDQGHATSILGMKTERDRVARTISISQPGLHRIHFGDFRYGYIDSYGRKLEVFQENGPQHSRGSPGSP